MTDLSNLEAIARATVLVGGAELRERYYDGDDDGDYDAYDVKAAADEAAEEQMLAVVRQAFPDHAVFAEEAGEIAGSEPYRWIIDPLDGTNNFTAGLPTFASSVAIRRNGNPELAAVYQPTSDEMYLARRDAGVRYQGERVFADSSIDVEAATVVTITGRDVPRNPALAERADDIRDGLDGTVKRVITSWAPTVHSGLLARGRLQGLVQFHPDQEEQTVTELFAMEADAATYRDGPLFIAASNEEALATIREATNGSNSGRRL